MEYVKKNIKIYVYTSLLEFKTLWCDLDLFVIAFTEIIFTAIE